MGYFSHQRKGLTAAGKSPTPQLSDFHILSIIGKGGFGEVSLCSTEINTKLYAVKCISKNYVLKNRLGFVMLYTELYALKLLNHPFIAKLDFAFQDTSNCYLAIEFLHGGDLRHYITQKRIFSDLEVANLTSCLLEAIQYIHSKRIIHRDIKPENIIFNQFGHPVISDFNISYIAPNGKTSTPSAPVSCTMTSGTRQYMAPEIFMNGNKHGIEADYWSLGIVLFEMIFLVKPFPSRVPRITVAYLEGEAMIRRNNNTTTVNTENGQLADNFFQKPSSGLITSFLKKSKQLKNLQSPTSGIDHHVMLPEFLTVPIPTNISYHISSQCLALLRSLLEIRSDYRYPNNPPTINNWLPHVIDKSGQVVHVTVPPSLVLGNSSTVDRPLQQLGDSMYSDAHSSLCANANINLEIYLQNCDISIGDLEKLNNGNYSNIMTANKKLKQSLSSRDDNENPVIVGGEAVEAGVDGVPKSNNATNNEEIIGAEAQQLFADFEYKRFPITRGGAIYRNGKSSSSLTTVLSVLGKSIQVCGSHILFK